MDNNKNKKKSNWGIGITIVIILFLTISIGQAVFIHKFIDYDLVEEEYYEAEIKYQDQIERIKRTKALPESLKIKLTSGNVEFDFPKIFEAKKITGVINLYKPSDDLLDKRIDIKLNEENKMLISTYELAAGLWKVKVNWSVDNIEYYNEKLLMVP